MKTTYVKKLVFTAACAALCIVLPMAFHMIPNAGTVFLPMHIPVLLCGLICGWPFGFVCGLIGPLLSSILTQMPPAAMLPSMMVECASYGCITGLVMKYVHTGKLLPDLYISMGTAMVLGRVLSGFAKSLIFAPGTAPFAWVTTSLVMGLPGISIQLVLMPAVILALTRARLIPCRYRQTEEAVCEAAAAENRCRV